MKVKNGTAYYFYKNLQGDVIAITNASGATVARYTYDAWGKCTVVSDDSGVGIANINPFRYRGYYYDTETELYYLQSRYYNPEVGRFINADGLYPFNETFISVNNLYYYCDNNPANLMDPYGRWAEKYVGFKITDVGFDVDYNTRFLSRIFCQSYAADIITKYGRFTWKYGFSFKRMNNIRIAKELYAHAILYNVGNNLIRKSSKELLINMLFRVLFPKSKVYRMTEKMIYLELCLGSYLFSRAKTFNINNNESTKRLIAYEAIWWFTVSLF